jgi:hypothetical protein
VQNIKKDSIISERGAGLLTRFLETDFEVFGTLDNAHASAASTEGSFDNQGKADTPCGLGRDSRVFDGIRRPRNRRNAGLFGEAPGGGLVAEQIEKVSAGSDKGNAEAFAGPRKGRILRQKPVSGVNGIHAFFRGKRYNVVDVQIGLNRSFALADLIGFIRFESMKAEPVFLRIDRYGSQLKLGRRAENPNRYLTAIQGQQFFHGISLKVTWGTLSTFRSY